MSELLSLYVTAPSREAAEKIGRTLDDCPCIVAWPIAAGHQPYLDWVAHETAS
jgi:uncharacterized protein involved in tolerance to divalent cations